MSESAASPESAGFEYIPNPLLYKASQFMLKAAIGGVHIHGEENIPDEPAVYISSHRSMLDIPPVGAAIYSVTRQPARYMAKRSLWSNKFFEWWLDGVGAYPVTQASKRSSERASIDELKPFAQAAKRGENVVVYGEGTRNKGEKIGAILAGGLFVANAGSRPIIPVGIAGTKPFRFHNIHVVFGDMIEADEVKSLKRDKAAGLELIREEIQWAYDKAREEMNAKRILPMLK